MLPDYLGCAQPERKYMTTSFSGIADAVAAANAIEVQRVAKVPGRVLFIDADMLCYQCGGNDDTDVATSRRILKSKIDLFMEASGAERVVLGLTGEGSTKGDRAVIAYTKPYQGQRKGNKPKNWQYLRNNTLVTVTSSHLVADTDLAQLCNKDTDLHQDASFELVAILT